MQRNLLATRHWNPICWPWNWNIVPNTVSRHQRQFRDQSVEMLGLFDPIGLNLTLDLSSDELLCTRWKIPQPSPFDKASQPALLFLWKSSRCRWRKLSWGQGKRSKREHLGNVMLHACWKHQGNSKLLPQRLPSLLTPVVKNFWGDWQKYSKPPESNDILMFNLQNS